MFWLLFKNKNINYNTDEALYSAIDNFLNQENIKNKNNLVWKRGYQGLWIGVSKTKRDSSKVIKKFDKSDKENSNPEFEMN
jgi:hypothetical protein